MIFLLKKKLINNINLININIKYINDLLYLCGKYGCLKINLTNKNFFNKKNFFSYLKYNIELNTGWVSLLLLNGLGFKSTRKLYMNNKRYWRFNVGHSHVFQYFTPKNIIMKVKTRYVCIFGFKKNQVIDITNKLKTFHVPDSYKGVGIKYPNEIIKLKKGKMRQ